MALDGAFLYLTAQEMRGILVGTRVEKIAQPSREELVMTFRLRGGSKKVLFSANAASPRVHFTEIALENPKSPPMFCMLLRKHIGAGKLLAIRQNGLDRVLSFDFETVNELGDSGHADGRNYGPLFQSDSDWRRWENHRCDQARFR